MARTLSLLLLLVAVVDICCAKIVTLDCSNTLVPGKVNGEFSSVCITNHAFKEGDATNWNLAKSKVKSTTFTGIEFKGDQDFSNTLWDQVTFKDCKFSGKSTNLFQSGEAKNVVFDGCTFAASADIVFQSMSLDNVGFKNCIFQNNWILKESKASAVSFDGCQAGGSSKAITFNSATVNGVSISNSAWTSTLKFLSADITSLSISDNTTFTEFHCGQYSGGQMSMESTFKNAKINGLKLSNFRCSQSTWSGFSAKDITYGEIIDLAGTTLSRVQWNGISKDQSGGSCGLIDVSYSQIGGGELISGLKACNITFKGTKFTDPVDFSGVEVDNSDLVSFRDATFTQVCVGNSSCVSICGKPSSDSRTCTCGSEADSTECTKAGSNTDETINEDVLSNNGTHSNSKKNDSGSCFPGDATVTLESGEAIQMTDLRHSHRVAIGGGKHSDVYFFGHRNADEKTEFIHISTAGSNKVLRISPGHYIYASGKLITARNVKVGDSLETWNEKKVLVTSVSRKLGLGKFAPATLHGNIMVDGIVVSSYTEALDPRVAHAVLSPLRALHNAGLSFLSSRFSFLHTLDASGIAEFFGLGGPEEVRRA